MSSPNEIGDDVIAIAANILVVACAAFEPVIAAITIKRVVTFA